MHDAILGGVDTGLVLSSVAGAASVAAAVVSIWQARVAGNQADSARRQALSSEKQVDLMRDQLAYMRHGRAQGESQQRRDLIIKYATSGSESYRSAQALLLYWGQF